MNTCRILSRLGMALLLLAGLTFAQGSKKETQLRTVRGVVSDKSEKPIQNGVVFLKNLRTNTVLSHFTDDRTGRERRSHRTAAAGPRAVLPCR